MAADIDNTNESAEVAVNNLDVDIDFDVDSIDTLPSFNKVEDGETVDVDETYVETIVQDIDTAAKKEDLTLVEESVSQTKVVGDTELEQKEKVSASNDNVEKEDVTEDKKLETDESKAEVEKEDVIEDKKVEEELDIDDPEILLKMLVDRLTQKNQNVEAKVANVKPEVDSQVVLQKPLEESRPMATATTEQVRQGNGLADGVSSLVNGTANLTGAVLGGVGKAANSLASMANVKKVETKESALPTVLPRISDYRIAQLDKAASNYEGAQNDLWKATPGLEHVRAEIKKVANEKGIPVQDVIEKMKPGGDLEDLGKVFRAEVINSPDAMGYKKTMEKSLDSYTKQYGRAQEETLNPSQQDDPHYDQLKERLKDSEERMKDTTAQVPAFEGIDGEVEQSHYERLKENIAAIMEKVKEFARNLVAKLKGHRNDDVNEPEPTA